MAYATQQDAIDRDSWLRLVVASDRGNDGQMDGTAVGLALDDASSFMDSYIGQRQDVPVAEPYPDVLIRCNVDIAVYMLAHSRPAMSESIRERYEKWVEWLKGFASGASSLGEDDPSASTARARFSGPARQYTRTTMKGLY